MRAVGIRVNHKTLFLHPNPAASEISMNVHVWWLTGQTCDPHTSHSHHTIGTEVTGPTTTPALIAGNIFTGLWFSDTLIRLKVSWNRPVMIRELWTTFTGQIHSVTNVSTAYRHILFPGLVCIDWTELHDKRGETWTQLNVWPAEGAAWLLRLTSAILPQLTQRERKRRRESRFSQTDDGSQEDGN